MRLFRRRILCGTLAGMIVLTMVGCGDISQNPRQSSEMEYIDTSDDVAETPEPSNVDDAAETLEESTANEETVSEEYSPEDSFYIQELDERLIDRITGVSYPSSDMVEYPEIAYEDLCYVHILHYDFDGQLTEGELICNHSIAEDLLEIFEELYENAYQIEKVRLIDEYDGDDDASMEDNNTSCFNYRFVAGTDRLSNHAYGLAIDINPLYNPYVTHKNGTTTVSPESGEPYADRTLDFAHKIDESDLCYRLFIDHGFTWGGAWNSSQDYQHFDKK